MGVKVTWTIKGALTSSLTASEELLKALAELDSIIERMPAGDDKDRLNAVAEKVLLNTEIIVTGTATTATGLAKISKIR